MLRGGAAHQRRPGCSHGVRVHRECAGQPAAQSAHHRRVGDRRECVARTRGRGRRVAGNVTVFPRRAVMEGDQGSKICHYFPRTVIMDGV